MPKWEYFFSRETFSEFMKNEYEDAFARVYTGIGAQGWELVSTAGPDATGKIILFFKRPVAGKP